MNRRLVHLVLGLALAMVVSGRALAGTIPESERWATVTHPGNPAYTPPAGSQYPYPPGRVDYEYQISRTETTANEWLEFVRAYAPHIDPAHATDLNFLSNRVVRFQTSPGVYDYRLWSEAEANKSVFVGWRYAARYINWLHNDKALIAEAFESGAYNTSTFGGNTQTGYTDQRARSRGATYFIPTVDEWVKAVYWDPERYDPTIGESGYWLYPHSSNTAPTGGPPGVGQTSAGSWTIIAPDVGSYPNVQSPWGLWDASGGEREWLETAIIDDAGFMLGRYMKGTNISSGMLQVTDHIRQIQGLSNDFPSGLRIARLVPTPSAAAALGWCVLSWSAIRRRRT